VCNTPSSGRTTRIYIQKHMFFFTVLLSCGHLFHWMSNVYNVFVVYDVFTMIETYTVVYVAYLKTLKRIIKIICFSAYVNASCGRLLLVCVCGILTIYVHRILEYVKIAGVRIPWEAPCLVDVLFLYPVWLRIWHGTTHPIVCSRTVEDIRTEWLRWQNQEWCLRRLYTVFRACC
jgi:hypothetical protein